MAAVNVWDKVPGDVIFSADMNNVRQTIGGDGADGDLTVAGGATNLVGGQVYQYDDVSITGGVLSLNNVERPMIINCKTFTMSAGTIDLDGKGWAGGAAIVNGGGHDGNALQGGYYFHTYYWGVGCGGLRGLYDGIGTNSGGGGGSTIGTNGVNGAGPARGAGGFAYPSWANAKVLFGDPQRIPLGTGGGGGGTGNGGVGGAGGAGGGTLFVECWGDFDFNGGTITADGVNGANGAGGGGSQGGGGGGGGGGSIYVMCHGTLTYGGATTVTGGAGGAAGGAGIPGHAGGAGAAGTEYAFEF